MESLIKQLIAVMQRLFNLQKPKKLGMKFLVYDDNDKIAFPCRAILLQNQGNTSVTLAEKWTINPGGSFSIDSESDFYDVVMSIRFAAGTTKRLEVCLILPPDSDIDWGAAGKGQISSGGGYATAVTNNPTS